MLQVCGEGNPPIESIEIALSCPDSIISLASFSQVAYPSTMDRKNIVGWQIRQLRIQKGMTVAQLASALPPSAILCAGEIAEVELQTRKIYDLELLGISRALGVRISELFGTPRRKRRAKKGLQ